MRSLYLFPLLLILFTQSLLAAEFRRPGQDYRALAMGNVGLVTATNSNALYYNPAAMAAITDAWFDFPSLAVQYDKEGEYLSHFLWPTELKSLLDVITGSLVSPVVDSPARRTKLADFLTGHPAGTAFSKWDMSFNGMYNVQKKGTTLGFNYGWEYYTDATFGTNSISYNTQKNTIQQIGFSMPIGMGQFVLGGTWRFLKTEADSNLSFTAVDAVTTANIPFLTATATTNMGSGYDVGLLWRTPSKMRMVWGAVYRSPIVSGATILQPEEMALGVAVMHHSEGMNWQVAADYRDITHQLDTTIDTTEGATAAQIMNRRLHMGLELGFSPVNQIQSMATVRLGYNQGYPSYGYELAMNRSFILGMTKYSEEVGTAKNKSRQDRTVWYMNFGF